MTLAHTTARRQSGDQGPAAQDERADRADFLWVYTGVALFHTAFRSKKPLFSKPGGA